MSESISFFTVNSAQLHEFNNCLNMIGVEVNADIITLVGAANIQTLEDVMQVVVNIKTHLINDGLIDVESSIIRETFLALSKFYSKVMPYMNQTDNFQLCLTVKLLNERYQMRMAPHFRPDLEYSVATKAAKKVDPQMFLTGDFLEEIKRSVTASLGRIKDRSKDLS